MRGGSYSSCDETCRGKGVLSPSPHYKCERRRNCNNRPHSEKGLRLCCDGSMLAGDASDAFSVSITKSYTSRLRLTSSVDGPAPLS